MGAIKIQDGIYSVGVLNPSLRVFDIVMESRYGTSYNAYLLTGEKNVLIETVHTDYFEEYLANIESVVKVSEIDYLVMNHTEPDHSGSVAKLLERNPQIQVICTMAAQKYLQAITNREFRCRNVKSGDRLDLGNKSLEFLVAPMLHWPDSMFTWDESTGTLFTCDFLGAHFCEPTMLDRNIHYPEQYREQLNYYFNCIFGPFKPYVLAGLDKIEKLPVTMACPSHGPCLVEHLQEAMTLYREWSTPVKKEKRLAAVLYASAYGCTAKLANAAADELRKDERLDVKLVDVVNTPLSESAALANEADILMIGSCTINRDAPKIIWDVLASVDALNTEGRLAGAFGSYGWSGEAIDMIRSRMEHLKFTFIGQGVKANFMPGCENFDKIREYARCLAFKMSSVK